VRGLEGQGAFLREVVGSVGLVVLFPSVSFALRLPQAIMRSRSTVAAVRVDS
jgi:hypothetical protein